MALIGQGRVRCLDSEGCIMGCRKIQEQVPVQCKYIMELDVLLRGHYTGGELHQGLHQVNDTTVVLE